MSCVYGFLSGKSQSTYEEFLQAVLDSCCDLGYQPDPTTIVTNFEQSCITAVSTTLGQHVHIQGCFYHLTQSTWRTIQELGLITRYRSEEDVKLFCGMIDGLAFLPTSDVSAGFDYLREHTPEGLEPLIDHFSSTLCIRNVSPHPSASETRWSHSPHADTDNSSAVSSGAVECSYDDYAWWIQN